MVNMKDLARECGVSVATVSRVINSGPAVSPETKAKVLAAAERLGFTPNLAARSLKLAKSRTVGIIIPSIDNYFYLDMLKYLEAELRRRGYRLLVSFVYHGVAEERDAIDTMSSARLEALIVFPRTRENSEPLRQLAERTDTKIIQLFTAPYDEYNSVVVDDALGVREATEHLIGHGHSKILYLGGDSRVEGYRAALADAEIVPDPRLISLDWLLDERAVAGLIKSAAPTAILAVARQAEAAWRALRLLDKKVPADISFVAYDDTNWVGMFDITAVAHPLDKLAATLSERLFFAIEHPDAPPERLVVKPYLKMRASVADIGTLERGDEGTVAF